MAAHLTNPASQIILSSYLSCVKDCLTDPSITVKIRLHPLGSAPPLSQKVFKISASNRFESVVLFLRKKLSLQSHDSVVCYVNSVFAPGLDEGVGGLWRVSDFE